MRRPNDGRTAEYRASTRCAIYTRKSHEEGLEQAFNSLDAQRESCEAYIRSQKHEGWLCLPGMYDDGGISGATLERPALKRLLADIEAGRIDAVVVYKVDRLTRSLSDFAKIVDVFDRRGVSFVSVTQQFNTTSSMGRLTLNMLLSFAQFEREVTGERIRDKIAASKRKGMWMGGHVPLGYDVKDRKLVVNHQEVEIVRHIFTRYAALGSVWLLKDALDHEGIVSKVRVDGHGRPTGGKSLARGAIYLMLQNRIYRGDIVHKENCYPGEHEAIVDRELWDEVQRTLAANRTDRVNGVGAAEPSLLAGLVYDDTGDRMTPSHANKKGTRYRYYVSQGLVKGGRGSAPRGRRVPARDLEGLIEDRVRQFLMSASEVFGATEASIEDVNERSDLVVRGSDLAGRWPKLQSSERRAVLTTLIDRIDLMRERLDIHIRPGRLASVLGVDGNRPSRLREDNAPCITLSIPARLKRTGMENRLLIEGEVGARRKPDYSLWRVLVQAHRYNAMVMRGDGKTIDQLAEEAGVGGSYFTRIFRLSFLAPEVVKSILRDRHPIELNAKQLAKKTRIPIAWEEQHADLLSLNRLFESNSPG